jgi:hypothetical protein
MASQPIVCKLEYNGDIRRFRLETPSYSEVVRIATRRFGLAEPVFLRVVFTDPDGDVITISSDTSLQDAIACAGSLLRLSLVPATVALPVNQEHATSSVDPKKSEAFGNKMQRKLNHLRSCRQRLAFRQQSVDRWSERVRREDGHARVEAVRQKLAAHLAQLEMRAKFLAEKHPAYASHFLEAIAEPSAEAMMAMQQQPERHGPAGIIVTCDGCEAVIQMTDIRYNCEDCWNFDLCEACEARNIHDPTHVLRKMRPEAQQARPFMRCARFGRRFGGCPRRFQHGPGGNPADERTNESNAHPHGGFPHGGFRRRGGCPWFRRHEESAPAMPTPPVDPVASVKSFINDTLIPLIQRIPGFEAIPVVDITEDLIETTQRLAPELFPAIAGFLPGIFKAGAPKEIANIDWGFVFSKIQSIPIPSQELFEALGSKLQEQLSDLEDVLPNLMNNVFQRFDLANILIGLQAAHAAATAAAPPAAAPQPIPAAYPQSPLNSEVLSSIRAFRRTLRPIPRHHGRGRCPHGQLNPFFHPLADRLNQIRRDLITPQPETPAEVSQTNLTADAILAALSVPAETITQLIEQSNNDPQLALALWEAMQE